jgi:nicotinamidase-related amidase
MLDPKTTALVLIDLQKGIVGNPQLEPRPGSEVVATAITVAETFRAAGALVVLVHVAFAKDYADMPSRNVDRPVPLPEGGMPDEFSAFVDGIEGPGDLKVLKRQWGAFYGTDLDLQLRRRGVRTIVLGGISTNIGVESTARAAWEHGYDLQTVEDLCAGPSTAAHNFAFETIFPRLSHVINSRDIHFAAN